ncbi:cell adhesion molecule CEACAM8-like isoform X3 [Aquarana catesbeiana]|uniref:cell adhesion molecule CEACAM8-like isoform X3 n=1 Tax=Aquarana catesbeiana TaxID=8400 RepID=UPI003CC96244
MLKEGGSNRRAIGEKEQLKGWLEAKESHSTGNYYLENEIICGQMATNCSLVLLCVMVDMSSGMMSIQLIPQYPVIEGSVTLNVTWITRRVQHFIWYKGPNTNPKYQILRHITNSSTQIIPGPLFKSKMASFSNGSLQISNLNITDEGNYTVRIQTNNQSDISVYLNIFDMVIKPTITASTPLPKENDTVTLTCTSTNAERIVWSRIPFAATLSPNNNTISFLRINRMNSGDYQCEAENPVSKRTSDPYTLTVAYGPENVKIIGQSFKNSAILLTCSADSVPRPSYQWFNGTNVSAQENTFHIHGAKLENKLIYTCVVSNPATRHTATASLYMESDNATTLCQTSGSGLGGGKIVGIVIGTVFGIFILEVIVYFVLKAKRKTPSSTVYENAHVPEQHIYEMTFPEIQEPTDKDKSIYSIIESTAGK